MPTLPFVIAHAYRLALVAVAVWAVLRALWAYEARKAEPKGRAKKVTESAGQIEAQGKDWRFSLKDVPPISLAYLVIAGVCVVALFLSPKVAYEEETGAGEKPAVKRRIVYSTGPLMGKETDALPAIVGAGAPCGPASHAAAALYLAFAAQYEGEDVAVAGLLREPDAHAGRRVRVAGRVASWSQEAGDDGPCVNVVLEQGGGRIIVFSTMVEHFKVGSRRVVVGVFTHEAGRSWIDASPDLGGRIIRAGAAD
jgi:hypothetical protein